MSVIEQLSNEKIVRKLGTKKVRRYNEKKKLGQIMRKVTR